MAGPNLEIFKFGLYVFFPVAIMFHYGNPEWYERHVLPVSCTKSRRSSTSDVYNHNRLTASTFLLWKAQMYGLGFMLNA